MKYKSPTKLNNRINLSSAQRVICVKMIRKKLNVLLSIVVFGSFLILFNSMGNQPDHKTKEGIIIRTIQPRYSDNDLRGPTDWLDGWYCKLDCTPNVPCEYKDEVDFRILVLTFNRSTSLEKTLNSILDLETLGDRVSVDIWVDRSVSGQVDTRTIEASNTFKNQWSRIEAKGRACIHIQPENAYITKQWTNTWRPKEDTKEIGLILEDDISLSPFSYKWLKATHAYFETDTDIAGYTLQMENINFLAPIAKKMKPLKVDRKHKLMLYPILGTWGYSPHPKMWRLYQDWYHTVRPDIDIKTDLIVPDVPGLYPTFWYHKDLEKNKKESTQSMWHIKFCHDYRLFNVYSNLVEHTKKKNVILSTNRMEPGLHFHDPKKTVDLSSNLMKEWKDSYVQYPKVKNDKTIIKLNYDGRLCTSACCFDIKCSN